MLAAHTRVLAAAPGRVPPLSEPAAGIGDGRDAVGRRAQRHGGRWRVEQSGRELDARVGRARAQGR